MTLCNYHILAYTCSELQPEGKPFVIVLYYAGAEPRPLQGYVLKRWEEMLPPPPSLDLSSINGFLEDLQYYSEENDEISRSFFRQLKSLSVGSVRNFASGVCALDELNSICPVIFGVAENGNGWRTHFDGLGSRTTP